MYVQVAIYIFVLLVDLLPTNQSILVGFLRQGYYQPQNTLHLAYVPQ